MTPLQFISYFFVAVLLAGCTSQRTTIGLAPVADDASPAIRTAPAPADAAPRPIMPPEATVVPPDSMGWVSLADRVPQPVSGRVYRVQIFASSTLPGVQAVVTQVRSLQSAPVRVLVKDGLYKVQVGDFSQRADAETHQRQMRLLEWPDAWVVEVAVEQTEAAVALPPAPYSSSPPPVRAFTPAGPLWTIQVVASAERDVARRLLMRLVRDGYTRSYIEYEDNLWKVRAGDYRSRLEAEQQKGLIASRGYPDAWLIQIP